MGRKLDLTGVRIYSNSKDDVRDVINLVGERVYLSDDVNFESYEEAELAEVNYANGITYPFFGGNGVGWFKYIIRAEDAKGEIRGNLTERKQSWKEIIDVGNSFWIRSKDNTEIVHLVTVTEISVNSEGSIVSIGLGTSVFPPKELLKNYEWSNEPPKDNDWRSFEILLEIRR